VSEEVGNVMIDNLGEEVSIDAVEALGVTPEEPTVYVGPGAQDGPNATSTADGLTVNVSQEYVFGGLTTAWQGAAPTAIDGTDNPALNLTAGNLYAFTWSNLDGIEHNVAILNSTGATVAETPGYGTTARNSPDPDVVTCFRYVNSASGIATVVRITTVEFDTASPTIRAPGTRVNTL
jgi:hypothetical protein